MKFSPGVVPQCPSSRGFDVVGDEIAPEQGVVQQVDLADGQVVRGPPPGVDVVELLGRERWACWSLESVSGQPYRSQRTPCAGAHAARRARDVTPQPVRTRVCQQKTRRHPAGAVNGQALPLHAPPSAPCPGSCTRYTAEIQAVLDLHRRHRVQDVRRRTRSARPAVDHRRFQSADGRVLTGHHLGAQPDQQPRDVVRGDDRPDRGPSPSRRRRTAAPRPAPARPSGPAGRRWWPHMNAARPAGTSAVAPGRAGPPGLHVGPGPMRDLPDRGRRLADGRGDLVVGETEHLMQHEHRPLVRGQALHHQHHRHRHRLGEDDVIGDVRAR